MAENFIGSKLLHAREEKGLSIKDVSEMTNIRKSYLIALEEENFEELPETVYTKNFIKLYARALGIDNQELVEHYESNFQTTPTENTTNVPEYRDFSVTKKSSRISPLLIILPLLALLLAAAAGLWFFNRDFVYKTFPQLAPSPIVLDDSSNTNSNNISTNTSSDSTTTVADTAATDTSDTDSIPNLLSDGSDSNSATDTSADNQELALNTNDSENTSEANNLEASANTDSNTDTQNSQIPAEIPETIKISIKTEPSGATVSIDNFVLAQTTPLKQAPISSGEKRNLVVSLDGYISYDENLDLYQDTNLEIVLEPVQSSIENTEDATATVASSEATAIKILTTEDTWLEVYQGTARGEGKELVYKVINAGREFNFDLPVYIHTGNAGGVRISINGKDIGKMGSSGEVLGKFYPKE